MKQIYSLTEAKAKFSEIINRALYTRESFTITKKGKAVAVVSPFLDDKGGRGEEGLIRARNALLELDRFVEDMVEDIYSARIEETDRKVNLY